MNTILPVYLVVNLLPSLLNLAPWVPVLLRLTLGLIFIKSGWNLAFGNSPTVHSGMKLGGWLMLLASIMVIIGLQTQLASIVLGLFSIIAIYDKVTGRGTATDPLGYHVLLLVLNISLVCLGAGALAFDLPL